MITDPNFSYLKANTVLFAQKVCESLSDMCGAQFIPLKESIKEGTFTSPYRVIMFISFTGAIQGNYLLSFDEMVALKLISAYDGSLTDQNIRDLREDFGGLLKETLNLAVGQSIEELEKSFRDLTFTPSTVVYGEIEFPNIMSGSITVEGREGRMLCGFSLNLANLKIGDKLEETLQELEKQTAEAEEAKKNISSILDLLPTGLIAIDAEGTILPGYSKSAPSTVGLKPDANVIGRFLPEFIGADAPKFEEWKNWLKLLFDKFHDLPFVDIKDLCPLSEFTNCHAHILKLDWLPVTGPDPDGGNDLLEKLLVVIEDVTSQRDLEKKMEELNTRHQENLELISQVINLQPDEITDFIYDSSELLSNAKTIVEKNNTDREFINELFRAFHTLKGSSGQYQFTSLQELAHKVEDHLKLFRDGNSPITDTTLDEIKHSIEDARGYINRIQDVRAKLGGKTETMKHKAIRDPNTVMASLDEIDAALATLTSLVNSCRNSGQNIDMCNSINAARTQVYTLRTIRLSFFQSAFNSLLDNTCQKTGKKASIAIGNDLRIDIAIMRKLHQCFIHLINNSIDHGIEPPDIRIANGKIDTGVITISAFLTDDNLRVIIQDDGKGIDMDAIRAKLLTAYNYSNDDIDSMSKKEFYDFLLKPGFSTKTETTEISGRGVGMDFVNHTISQMSGTLSIDSISGKGTSVTLLIPLKFNCQTAA